tara:strand:+ start:179 stop:580 length:402 start_codon:yes stop_codon:yes gene_type:complete
MVTYGTLTDYPDIYNNVYWGQFTVYKGNKPDRTILENRNNLVVKKGIVKIIRDIPNCILENFPKRADHMELYELSTGKRLLISSPYDKSEKNYKEHIENGFIEIEKLYSDNSNTYAALVRRRDDKWVIEVQQK